MKKSSESRTGAVQSRPRSLFSGGRARLGLGLAASAEVAPIEGQHAAQRHAREPDHEQRQAPADELGEADGGDRCRGEAGIAAEGMDREGPPDPGVADAVREDRIVGRVVDGVAHARQHHEPEECREDRPHADEPDRHREGHVPGDQDPRRAHAVDEKADGRLADHRHDVEKRQRQAQLRHPDAQVLLQDRKERRQRQDVEMGEEVPARDQAGDLDVGCGARLGRGQRRGAHRQRSGVGGATPSRSATLARPSMMPG